MDLQTIETATKLRRRIFLTAYSGGMAHLASSFSAVEILYALYLRGVMNHDPHDPAKPDRDRFVLSKGHGALALYAVLRRIPVVRYCVFGIQKEKNHVL